MQWIERLKYNNFHEKILNVIMNMIDGFLVKSKTLFSL